MGIEVWAHLVYMAIATVLTLWVGRTIKRHGRIFLMDVWLGKEAFADAVNQLLIVGFYIVTFGYVTLSLRYGPEPATAAEAIETVSTKIGIVALILGGTHLFNLYAFSRVRRRAPFAEVKEPQDGHAAVPAQAVAEAPGRLARGRPARRPSAPSSGFDGDDA